MPLDDDVFCISGLTSTTANACTTAPASCCVNGRIALDGDVFCAFAYISSDACRTV